jgi:hypothetical protein
MLRKLGFDWGAEAAGIAHPTPLLCGQRSGTCLECGTIPHSIIAQVSHRWWKMDLGQLGALSNSGSKSILGA